jgi:IS605 OrfB family transposase
VVDNNLYSLFTRPKDRFFKGCWLRISTFPGQKRMCIPLAGKNFGNLDGKTKRNLRITFEDDGRILFVIPREIILPNPVRTKKKLDKDEIEKELLANPTLEVVAIDKGMVNTIVANATNDPLQAEFYGTSELAKKVSDKQEIKFKNRQRLQAYSRELTKSEKTEDQAKAGRIISNNLGKIKQTRSNTRDKTTITQLSNQVINQLFKAHPQMRVLVEEDLTKLQAKKGKNGKAFNRRISRWARGALTKALENKCPLHGVERQLVAAAYTSQACPVCFYVNSKNRSNQVFHCRNCGYDAHADAVASSNIRVRFFDPDISRYTSRAKIKEILLQRYQRRSELASGVQTAVG